MPDKRKIIDARADNNGVITHVLFKGNQQYTPIKQAISIADGDGIENAHPVRPKNKEPYLRTNPDNLTSNNLDDMLVINSFNI